MWLLTFIRHLALVKLPEGSVHTYTGAQQTTHEPSLVTRSIKGMCKLYTRASSMVGYSILSLPLLFFALQGRPHKLCDWPISAQPGNNIPYCAMAAMQCEIFTMHCTGAFDIQHEKSIIYMQE